MTDICPTCGQELLIRHGVKLQRKKAHILDAVEKYTKNANGIELDRLAWLIYPDDPKPKARQRVKVHISQINDLLVSTDCRVINQHGFYRFAEVKW